MRLGPAVRFLLLTAATASCQQRPPANYFTANSHYNTPHGPVYYDEYRLFGHHGHIGSYGYRYGDRNHNVEVNFQRPSVTAGHGGHHYNPHHHPYNPSVPSPSAWPPYHGSGWTAPSTGGGYGTRPSPPGFAPGYPGGHQSYPSSVTNYPSSVTNYPSSVTNYPSSVINYPSTVTNYPVSTYPSHASAYPTAAPYPATHQTWPASARPGYDYLWPGGYQGRTIDPYDLADENLAAY